MPKRTRSRKYAQAVGDHYSAPLAQFMELFASGDTLAFRPRVECQELALCSVEDAAFVPRDSDNRAQVSALLNLSDGMLGNLLRLQVICTIDGRAADMDQALLRLGRLLCHRIFHGLTVLSPAVWRKAWVNACPTSTTIPRRKSSPTPDILRPDVRASASRVLYKLLRPEIHFDQTVNS